MKHDAWPPPLRVEQALRVLPDVDALLPLRPFLIAASRSRPPAEPYETVGKRYLQPGDLREMVPRAVALVKEHLIAIYESVVAALEAEQEGDAPAVVAALLRAGDRERSVGREIEAHAWYHHALGVAEELRERRPEIEALLRLGRLELDSGRLEEGARHFQRALALAEAERDVRNAAHAGRGLGTVAVIQGRWHGAESWYTRALHYAADDRRLAARLHLDLGEVSRSRGSLEEAAERVKKARAMFEELGDAEGAVRSLNAWGRIEFARKRYVEAVTAYREALARLQQAGGNARLETSIRLNLCELQLAFNRLPEAEDEARRTEELAISQNFTRQLARLYVVMGRVRGAQGDETGFVFFEKALELCRGPEPAPRLEADVYLEYGRFRKEAGDHDDARACFERGLEILHTLGDGPASNQFEQELGQLSAA